ncbi:MAG: hypothetical protein LUG18_03070, partial [Candidatus Azobacteroides sp.]|nr:hypothetical protein [Candidatus Azobacteroides sp.]
PLITNLLFEFIYKNEQVIQLSLNREDVVYIGKISKIFKKSFYLDPLGVKGNWLDHCLFFKMETIRIISFDTDYISALLVYNKETYG